MNKDELKEALREELDARSPVDKETHIKHHRFIDVLIGEYEAKKARNEKIKQNVIVWGILAILSGIGTAVYQWFEHFVQGGQ